MNEALDDLRKYLRALETGDPDRQLCNPDDDVVVVRAGIAELERLSAEVSRLKVVGHELGRRANMDPDDISEMVDQQRRDRPVSSDLEQNDG